MKWETFAAMAAATATLMIGAMRVDAQERKHDCVAALSAKLGLDERQAKEISSIHADFDKKMDAAEEQIWTAKHAARAEFMKVLTDAQRAQLPDVMKAEWEKQERKIADKIGLNDKQRKEVERTWAQFGTKFKELADRSPTNVGQQFNELKHSLFTAIAGELTDEQLIKLHGVMREEFHQWRQPAFQREHVKAIEDKLGLNADQRAQADKIVAQCERNTAKPLEQLKELMDQERAAVDKTLTAEQRTKLNQLMKTDGNAK